MTTDPPAAVARQWIESPAFDLAFFVLSPALGVLMVVATPLAPYAVPVAFNMLLGFPHYFSTFAFYLWDEYRPRHRARWAAFFAGPVVVVGATALVFAARLPAVVAFATYFWNAWHVSRQSCGILSIYRHRAGIFDPRQKTLANTAIISTNLCCAVWNTEWYPPLHRVLTLPGTAFPQALRLGLLALALASVTHLGIALWQRHRAGLGPHAAESAFLASSLLLFHPYLWVPDAELATLAMLIGHFLQYLAIVWLLHRRKFRVLAGSTGQVWLARLAGDLRFLLPALTLSGIGAYAVYWLMGTLALPGLLALAFTHFYLDALFWTFRDPSVRDSLGPYVIGSPPRPGPAASPAPARA